MTKKPENYRLRILEPHTVSRETFKTTYIVRKGDRVSYIGSDETPLALSNLISKDAAGMRFKLEDADDGDNAAKCLRSVLADQWKNNKTLLPVVEVLP